MIDLETIAGCVLCGATGSRPLFEIPPLGYVACASCGLVRTSPRIAARALGRYYAETYREVYQDSSIPYEEQLENPTFAFRAARLARFAGGRRFYEIGCGDGNFLAALQRRGWSVHGCDVSETGARAARERHGIDIDVVSFDALHLAGSYDAVGLYHVLEHLYDPRDVLCYVARILPSGGVLHVQIPNIRSLDGKLGRQHWWGLRPPQHVYFYEPSHLRRLLAEEGFDVISIGTFDPWHSPAMVEFTLRSWMKGMLGRGPQAGLPAAGERPAASAGARYAQTKLGCTTRLRPILGVLRRVSGGLARAEALVGYGNVADVVARRRA